MYAETANRFRSEGERRVVEALRRYPLRFDYEPWVQIHTAGGTKRIRPDFYVGDADLFIEYFGRIGNQQYDERTRTKMQLYESYGLSVFCLYPWDLCSDWPKKLYETLDDRLASRPKSFSRSTCPSYSTGFVGPQRNEGRTGVYRQSRTYRG